MYLRIIIDTNLWVSYLIGGELAKFDTVFDDPEITLLFSSEVLEELVEVAARPKLAKYFDPNDLSELLQLIDNVGEVINVNSTVTACRDPKDNFLLALAADGDADYLVTGDLDLLSVGTFDPTQIIMASDFLRRISN